MSRIDMMIAAAGPSAAANPHEPDGYAWPDKAHCRKCNRWLGGTPEGWRTLAPIGETWKTTDPSTFELGGLECE